MALLKIWEGSRGIMRVLVIQFVCWLGCFSTFALAQSDMSEVVTGSVTFPALGITCVSNLAVFVTTLIRGRLDLEIGARDVIDILLSPKLEEIKGIKHGYGLTTCSQGNATETATSGGGGDVGAASAGENDVQSSASTEENVQSSPTEGGGLQTISTEERVIHIGSTGHVGSTQQEDEEEDGLKTAGVIILSNGTPNWSMRQFIKSNAHVVDSIILQFLPLYRSLYDRKVKEELTAGDVTVARCECRKCYCECIVFWTVEKITSMLARRMPGMLKRLTDSLCLLPCSTCLTNGCHGCNPESLLREEGLANEGQSVRQNEVVSAILRSMRPIYILPPEKDPLCICIPMNDARGDNWTKLLLRSLRSKDAEGRGVRNMATEALEGYLAGGRGSEEGTVEYDIFSFVVPRLTEVLINLVLTFWFRVDGFSSALVARRTVRDYLVDTKSSGFAANAFLTKAVVKSNGDNSPVCQVLNFRGRDWLCITTFISMGCVNVICALGWALLITFEGGPDTSQPPSLPRVAVIIAAIGSPWVVLTAAWMVEEGVTWDASDSLLRKLVEAFLELFSDTMTVRLFVVRFLETLHRLTVRLFVVRLLDFLPMTGRWFVRVFVLVLLILAFVVISPVLWPGFIVAKVLKQRRNQPYASALIGTGLLFEMACFVSWSALARAFHIKGFGRWLYGALQILIWVKWATGCYLLNQQNSTVFLGRNPDRTLLIFYSSAFWLNAVLAGVRCKWEAWPWKHNHLFSFVSQ